MTSLFLDRSPGADSVNDGATKAKTMGYWVTTGVLVFCMTGGIFELLSSRFLRPGLPRLKEWAYAGTFFNMMGAIVSHVVRNDGAWIIVVTITIAAITLASWALRPESRRLGDRPKNCH